METQEFDSALGGNEELPFSANSLKFAASRNVEIVAMTESILRPSKTKLIFQTLPVHMRRRVMSHNSKRLPRKLREGHIEQLKKSGLPPKQKRPSRKYRRRPGNLLEEYKKRGKHDVWLETHIWYAKRFHMVKRWHHKLAYAPCDKAFRACYRASSAHCLMQDVSYYTPFQITGSVEDIKNLFSNITSCSCGLSVGAKACISGNREGTIHLYKANSFPFGYIGKIKFLWVDTITMNKELWLFVHPSQVEQVKCILTNEIHSEFQHNELDVPNKRRKLTISPTKNIEINVLPGRLNRFQLTGPNSHAVLVRSLKAINNTVSDKYNDWTTNLPENFQLYLSEKSKYWKSISSVNSPSQLPPRIVVALVVKDPRISRPTYRTKALPESDNQVEVHHLLKIPQYIPTSPLWDLNIHEAIQKKRLSNAQFIKHVTKTQLIPGEVNENDPAIQNVPVVLIQRPGSQDPNFKKVGYGSGWDIIIPSGYGMPFWQTFIMFGARSGGLRETENLVQEMGECYLPPDSAAGQEEEFRIETEMKEKYFRLPPSKRVNFTKLAMNSPFICPWKILLKDWGNTFIDDYYVLRDKILLDNLQDCKSQKVNLPDIKDSEKCLVPVYIQLTGKGNLKQHAQICLPELGDNTSVKTILEPHHDDPNTMLRKQKRKEHVKNIKCWRRKRLKLKKKQTVINAMKTQKRTNSELSEYVKTMRELWVPSDIKSVRFSASRQVLGYLSQGAFSFTEAQCCGVGYIAYNALYAFIESKHDKVLVRNTTSRTYRWAILKIIKAT